MNNLFNVGDAFSFQNGLRRETHATILRYFAPFLGLYRGLKKSAGISVDDDELVNRLKKVHETVYVEMHMLKELLTAEYFQELAKGPDARGHFKYTLNETIDASAGRIMSALDAWERHVDGLRNH